MHPVTLDISRGRDQGQDLAEYCLITALIALIALGIFCHVSGGIQGMWSSTGTTLAAANASAGTQGAAGAVDTSTNQSTGR